VFRPIGKPIIIASDETEAQKSRFKDAENEQTVLLEMVACAFAGGLQLKQRHSCWKHHAA
jgi:hypothetical protein